jgi:hypothetical protein
LIIAWLERATYFPRSDTDPPICPANVADASTMPESMTVPFVPASILMVPPPAAVSVPDCEIVGAGCITVHGKVTGALRGETVARAGPDGWVLVCFERWGLGWARRRDGVLKNHLPSHLRTRNPPAVSGAVG